MIKRSFFGLVKPKLHYERIEEAPAEPIPVKASTKIRLHIPRPGETTQAPLLKVGDPVKNGQKIALAEKAEHYLLASKSGKISEISPFVGILGETFTAVTVDIDADTAQIVDDQFKSTSQMPSLEKARDLLAGLPGKPDFTVFFNADHPVKTMVVLGADCDLLSTTRQYFVKNNIISIKTGIDFLRKITGIHDVILIVPQHLAQVAGSSGATVKTVDSEYPSAHPHLIRQHVLSTETPDHGAGVAFFSAEAVAAIGAAFNTGKLPLDKLVSFISKDGTRRLVSVPIGTPLQDILNEFNEKLEEGDQLIVGGPLRGISVYAADYPVMPDTDTLIVQNKSRIAESEGAACVNCGDCVRVCPSAIQVNLLVRYLEVRQFQEGADQYDLFSCIECGFCSYVCESRIPIFQHIRLAKYTLERMKEAEDDNV
ncbi:MAG: 4Fe-4S dicluster domain-containing protein [Desulfosalsimonadaceae bacterium]|nr:4Fe-4S dicluster domain-containing protein [Desulfosalsimonadaceae bacterium]